MNYEIVTLPEKKIAGIKTRTSNSAPDCQDKIGGLWKRLMCGGECEKLSTSENAPLYGIYTNYGWDDQSYDVIAGCESGTCPEGFEEVTIPAGRYARFSFRGDVRESVAGAWNEIWSTQLPRAYTVDFEEYANCGEDMQGDIYIYVALADACQSCGMPMIKPEDYGSEKDGSPSSEYCNYCYKNGRFTSGCTMEEMIELNIKCAPDIFKDPAAAREQMKAYFPTLKRWKNA